MAYYLTAFRIEGHETWRAHIAGHVEGFQTQVVEIPNAPKVTSRKRWRLDKITGELSEI